MKRLAIVAAFALLAMPAHALTFEEVQAELSGGYSCSGSACTLQTDTTETRTVQTSPGHAGSDVYRGPVEGCFTTFMGGNGKLIPATNVDSNCVPLSLVMTSGGVSAKFGTKTSPACTTTTKELGFDPGTGFSVDTSTSTSSGAC